VEVDLGALRHNVRSLKQRAGSNCLLMACVKGDGYGHGMVPVAEAVASAGADRLGVAYVDEGIALRQSGVRLPIHILLEPPVTSAEELRAFGLTATLSTTETMRGLAGRLTGRLPVHVEVDAGMGRGLPPDEVEHFLRLLDDCRVFELEGLFGHLPSAGAPECPELREGTRHQISRFAQLAEGVRGRRSIPLVHLAASDALSFYPESRFDMVRPGAWVYGYKSRSVGMDLRPALTWKARVIQVLPAPKGRAMGYEGTFVPSQETRVAILGVGYADGYPRALSSRGEVLLQGRRLPVVGLVGMEWIMVEIGMLPVRVGEIAVLIGRQGDAEVTAAELGARMGQYGAALTCGIKERVERFYLESRDLSR
jgi:alanine racemase